MPYFSKLKTKKNILKEKPNLKPHFLMRFWFTRRSLRVFFLAKANHKITYLYIRGLLKGGTKKLEMRKKGRRRHVRNNSK